MITDNVRNLFQFVEFLHENIENFNKYNPAILEWKKARLEERKFGNHYTEKLKMREVQEVIKSKWNLLVEQIIDPIKSKANELSVCDLDQPISIYTKNSRDIILLIENFDVEEIEEIMRVKRLYITLRNELNADIINLMPLFFRFFDEMMIHVAERFWEDGDREITKIIINNYRHKPYIPKEMPVSIKDESQHEVKPELKGLKEKKASKETTNFSVPQWAAIFYYAESKRLLPEAGNTSEKLKAFKTQHNINRSFDSLKNKYYEVKNRINKDCNYPTDKLNEIIPFMKIHYKQTITVIKNDIILLEEEKTKRDDGDY